MGVRTNPPSPSTPLDVGLLLAFVRRTPEDTQTFHANFMPTIRLAALAHGARTLAFHLTLPNPERGF